MSTESGGWLAVSRFDGERIEIGNDIEILVVRSDAGKVKLAVRAPAVVPVHRAEIAAAIRADGARREAAKRAAYANEVEAAIKRG